MKRISRILLIISCMLGLIVRFPDIAYHATYSKSADIRITKTLIFDDCFYSGRMMQDKQERVFVELFEHLVMIDTDGHVFYYHIPHSFPFDWNVIGDTIHIQKGDSAYEYTQDGTFLRSYSADSFQAQFGSHLIERDGFFYKFFRTGKYIVGIKEESISTGEERVILWSFTRKVYDAMKIMLSVSQGIVAILFFASLFSRKNKGGGKYKQAY